MVSTHTANADHRAARPDFHPQSVTAEIIGIVSFSSGAANSRIKNRRNIDEKIPDMRPSAHCLCADCESRIKLRVAHFHCTHNHPSPLIVHREEENERQARFHGRDTR